MGPRQYSFGARRDHRLVREQRVSLRGGHSLYDLRTSQAQLRHPRSRSRSLGAAALSGSSRRRSQRRPQRLARDRRLAKNSVARRPLRRQAQCRYQAAMGPHEPRGELTGLAHQFATGISAREQSHPRYHQSGLRILSTRVTLSSRIAAAVLALGATLTGAEAGADVVAVVSAKSDIKTLTASQVADIFLGRVSHFPNGVLAVPIDLSDGSPERNKSNTKTPGRPPRQVKVYGPKIFSPGGGNRPRQYSPIST